MSWRRGRCRVVARPNQWTGFALGVRFCTSAQKGVFHKAAAGEGGGARWVCRRPTDGGLQTGLRSAEGSLVRSGIGRFQTRVWPKATDSLPAAVSPLRVTSPLFSFCCQVLVKLSGGKKRLARVAESRGLSMVLVADDCCVGIAPVEHVVSVPVSAMHAAAWRPEGFCDPIGARER